MNFVGEMECYKCDNHVQGFYDVAMVYRLYLIKDGKETYYGSSTYVDYMSELIDDYVRTNGNSGDNFSFKVEISVR